MNNIVELYPQDLNTANHRTTAQAEQAEILTNIYEPEVNMAIWRRQLSANIKAAVSDVLVSQKNLQCSLTVTPESVYQNIYDSLGKHSKLTELSQDIAELVDMFCFLFDLKQVGLRLAVLDRAMCPRFHVDRVPCRLVTTYHGIATEWLAHEQVDRTKLGTGNQGLPDELSGIFQHETDIQQLQAGDVALLKGELWENNEGAGLVHRSPVVNSQDSRLLLTLDFSA